MRERAPHGHNGEVQSERDAALLRRFVAVRDQTAFEELVRRHGLLVMRVCSRVLASCHGRGDAFQATFLTLAARADKIKKASSLASWLHGVALRVAKNLRRENAIWRRNMNSHQEEFEHHQQRRGSAPEWQVLLDEELSRLPVRYKDAVLLCDCGGGSRKEAAAVLGIPVGTQATNLRGREALRSRLAKSGMVVVTGGVTAALGTIAQAAMPVSAELIHSTARRSLLFLAGQSAGKAVEASVAVHLAQSVVRRMVMAKLLSTSALCIAVAALVLAVPEWARTNLLRAQPQSPYTFGEPVVLSGPIDDPSSWDSTPSISADGLELFFFSSRENWATYVARCDHPADPFGPPTRATELAHAVISQDGLSLYGHEQFDGCSRSSNIRW